MEFHEKIDKIFRDAELMRAFFKELEGIDPGPLYDLQVDADGGFVKAVAGAQEPNSRNGPLEVYESLRAISLEESGGDEEKRARLHIAFICEHSAGWPTNACNSLPILRDRGYLLVANHEFPSAPIPILDFLAVLRGRNLEPVTNLGRMAVKRM